LAVTWTCKHFGIDCDHEVTGETEEEVKKRWSEHAHARHPLDELPDYIRDKVRAVIPE
jgi:predicted small metal-binding protein